jgi:hypothetical protein
MALSANNWYSLTFNLLSHASWANPPKVDAALLKAVRDGTPLIAFCVSGGDPFSIVFEGGAAANVAAAKLSAPETPITTQLDTYDNGDTVYSMKQTVGGLTIWYSYDSGAGVRKLTDSTALGTLIT